MRRIAVIWLASLAAVSLLAAPQTLRAQTEQSIEVLVNDDPITGYDIEQRMRFLTITTQEQASPALKKKATDMLIEERLQLQEGRKVGVTADEEDVSKIYAGMAQKNNMSPEALSNSLAQMGINAKTLKDRIRSQVVWQQVVQKKFRRDVNIGDLEIDRMLSNNDGGDAPEKTTLQLRHLKLEVSSKSDQAELAKHLAEVEGLRPRVTSCSKISSLATSVKGLTVNTLQDRLPSSLPQPTRTLILKAKVGEMTPPVFSGSAIEAYAVCGKRTSRGDPKVRQQAEAQLFEQELGIRAEGLLRDLRQDAFIEHR